MAFLTDLDPSVSFGDADPEDVEQACEAAGETLRVEYADLQEMPLEPRRKLRLRSSRRGQRLPVVSIADEDAATVQAALDLIDRKLAFS